MRRECTGNSRVKMDIRIIPYCGVILFIIFLALFKLPWFSPNNIKTVTGRISNISVEEESAGTTKRKVLYFDIDCSSYYFTLTNIVNGSSVDSLLVELQKSNASLSPVSIETTTENDYRDLLLSRGRIHAISLSYDSQSITLDSYKKDVAFVRAVLLVFAFILSIPLYFFFK